MDPKEAEILGSLRDPSASRAGGDKTAEAVAARQIQAPRGVLTFADTLEQVTLEDVAVHFSADEWSLLEGWQKALHQEVMQENYTLLLSLGHSVPSEDLPSVLRPPEGTFESQALGSSRGGGSDAEGEEAPLSEDAVAAEGPWDLDCVSDGEEGRLTPGSGGKGDRQSSLHLCALMKLVKEIPAFLYGHGKASGGDSGGSEAGAAAEAPHLHPHHVKAEARMENLHHASLEAHLAEVSLSLPSRPDTPTSSTEGDWGEPRTSGLHTQDVATNTEVAVEKPLARGWLKPEKEAALPDRPCCQSRVQDDRPQTGLEVESGPGRAADEAKSLLTSYEGSTKAGAKDGAENRPSTPQAPARDLPHDGATGDVELRRGKSRAGRNLPKGMTDHLRGPEPDACGCHHRGRPSASGSGRLAAAPLSRTPSTAPSPQETTSTDPDQQSLPSTRKEGGGGGAGALGGLPLSSSCAMGERLLPETVGQGGASTHGLPNPAAPEATAEERPLQGLLLARSLRELLLHQPPPSHQAPWQHVPRRRRREVGSGPPPVPVKTEAAAEEEEPPFHSQGDSGRDGSESSTVPGGSSPLSTVWPEGGGRGSPPERPASSPFAAAENCAHCIDVSAVQRTVLTDGSPLPCLERTVNSVSPPRGAAVRRRTAPETGGLHVRIKTEPTAEEEPALQGVQELPAGRRLQPSLPNHSASHYGTKAGMDLGLWEPYSEEWSPVTSPLHGLLNCLKEIPTPGPPSANSLAGKRGGGGERRKGGRRGRPDALLETVLPPGPAACHLGERPVKQPQPAPVAQPSSRASSNLRYDAEWRKPEAGVALLSRKEDALGLGHGGSSSSAPWQGLERCLEEPPLHAHSQPPSPAVSSSFSSSPGELRRWTPEMGKWTRTEAGLSRNSSPGQGLGRCVKELLPPNAHSQPCSPVISSSPDRLQGWMLETAGKWTREEEEDGERQSVPAGFRAQNAFALEQRGASQPPRVPPLQGLENCLKDIPTSGTSLPGGSVAASSRCSGQKRRRAEDTSQRLWPGERVLQSPASLSGSMETDTSVERSPLHRLMRCLQGFPIQRPSYLRTPSVSSSSSSCSEAERDQQSPGSGPWWDGSQDTCRGSELDVAVGQKGMESSRRRSPVSALPSDKERVPSPPVSAPQGEVDHGAAGTSPLRGLENCLKDIADSQLRCSSSPLACANLHRDAAPGRPPEAGALGARPAGSLPASGLQSCLKDPAAGTPRRSQTQALDPPGRKAERDMERSHLEAQVPRQHPEAPGEAAARSPCLQGSARDLAEWPAKPSPSSSQDNSEPREWDAAHRSTPSGEEEGLTDSSPLQGLLRCLQEITAGGPSPHSSSASDTREEARPKRAEEETDPSGRTSQEGLGSCLKERPGSRGSPATTPLSSPVREKVRRSPPPAAVGGGHRAGGVVPTSSAACGVGTAAKAAPGGGNLCALSRRAPPHKLGAPRWSDSGSPSRSGSKRSLVTARGRDSQGAPCSFKSRGNGSNPKAEPENPSKKRCPALALPVPSCSWGPGKPPEGLAGVGGLAPVLLCKKLDRLSTDMSAICRDVTRLQSHMDRLEEDARGWALELATLRMENRCLSEHVRRMESRCRTLENRSRRNNLRLLGLPEGAEGRDAVSFLQKTLPAILGLPPDAPPLALESARRVQAGLSWDPNGRPRPLVFRLLRFADKAAILQAARRQPLSYAGTQVTISPDFCSSLLQRRRIPFGAVRRSRWAPDLCLGARRHACCWAWTREPREPLASSGPLAGEREGRGPKGPGTDQWGTGALEGPGRPGGCPASGSLEQHSPTHK